jgi:hypothetical protein
MKRTQRWWPAAIVIAVLWLGFGWAFRGQATQPGQPPFRNPVDQREQMIRELQEIKGLMQEQNALLRQVVTKNGQP